MSKICLNCGTVHRDTQLESQTALVGTNLHKVEVVPAGFNCSCGSGRDSQIELEEAIRKGLRTNSDLLITSQGLKDKNSLEVLK